MGNICPHTQNVCPVLVNLERLSEANMAAEETIALIAISRAIRPILERGSCEGPFSQNGDDSDVFYSGITSHCGNSNVPDAADKVDQISQESLLGDSELFEIENIGKVRS